MTVKNDPIQAARKKGTFNCCAISGIVIGSIGFFIIAVLYGLGILVFSALSSMDSDPW